MFPMPQELIAEEAANRKDIEDVIEEEGEMEDTTPGLNGMNGLNGVNGVRSATVAGQYVPEADVVHL